MGAAPRLCPSKSRLVHRLASSLSVRGGVESRSIRARPLGRPEPLAPAPPPPGRQEKRWAAAPRGESCRDRGGGQREAPLQSSRAGLCGEGEACRSPGRWRRTWPGPRGAPARLVQDAQPPRRPGWWRWVSSRGAGRGNGAALCQERPPRRQTPAQCKTHKHLTTRRESERGTPEASNRPPRRLSCPPPLLRSGIATSSTGSRFPEGGRALSSAALAAT